MARKVHRIDSLPADAPRRDAGEPAQTRHPLTVRTLDRLLAVQRPVVLAHLRGIRNRHPDATPADIAHMLERRYLTAVTTGGAAVGATAVIPGIGTATTLALSGVETAGFLEATALYAQSLAELHGIPVENPDRARALVLALMLGREGSDLVGQFARQAGGRGAPRSSYWGELVTSSLPRTAVGPVLDRLTHAFLRRFAAAGSASVVGKALPFGIGAAIGGTGNHILGRRIVSGARRAFGVVPGMFPAGLDPRPGDQPIGRGPGMLGRRIGGVFTGAGRQMGAIASRPFRRDGSGGSDDRDSVADGDEAGRPTAARADGSES
ncbi:hypothetical protein [Microbacterium sp. cf332]|uniref:hypothetical protein n=1 Tax=Microbacterium sp. cf332 TaxID=1761804 RepID=UPI0008862871|nr:hypothetical protein [Microbacterium sp. cf332]SDQ14404.1 hypothetical protein SAMN04487847_0575 [Microbacterium sp. cf332]